jgi:hypothetical protein
MSVDLPVEATGRPNKRRSFIGGAERLQAAPGVERVGVATALPLQWIGNGEAMKVPGWRSWSESGFKRVDGLFRALGIPVLAGRGITSRDVGRYTCGSWSSTKLWLHAWRLSPVRRTRWE